MSDSKSTKTDKTRATKTPRARKTPARASVPPWVEGGIDYGPAILAIDELVSWAFDLADENVADWPAARRQVSNARRLVRASIAGKRSGPVPHEDVVFAASLLVRILDADLGLGLADVTTVLEELGLPTEEAAPVPPRGRVTAAPKRRPPAVVVPAAASTAADDERLAHIVTIMAGLTATEVEVVKQSIDRLRPTEHDALVSMLCGLTVEQSIAWIRAVLIPSAPTPIAMGRRAPRVVSVGPTSSSCVGCPAVSGFRRAA